VRCPISGIGGSIRPRVRRRHLELQKDGTWANAVLSQSVSPALNLRLSERQQHLQAQAQPSLLAEVLRVGRCDADFELGSFALTSTLSTQGAVPGPDGVLGTCDDELDLSSARPQLTLPASVLNALGHNAAAADLLRVANAARRRTNGRREIVGPWMRLTAASISASAG